MRSKKAHTGMARRKHIMMPPTVVTAFFEKLIMLGILCP